MSTCEGDSGEDLASTAPENAAWCADRRVATLTDAEAREVQSQVEVAVEEVLAVTLRRMLSHKPKAVTRCSEV